VTDTALDLRALELAAETAPEAAAPADALDAALARAGRHADRVRLWQERAALQTDPAQAASASVRAAAICLEPLGDARRARALLEPAMALFPDHLEGRALLLSLLKAGNDIAGLVEHHERTARVSSGAAAAVALIEAANLSQESLKQPARAALDLLRAFRADPSQRAALQRARALMLADRQHRSALVLLEDERRTFGGTGLGGAFAEIAESLSAWPAQFTLAREAAQAALQIDPEESRAQAVVARLDAVAAGWGEEVRTLRSRAPEERDRKRAGAMQLRIAQLYFVFDDGPTRDQRMQEALTKCGLLYPAMRELREFIEDGAEQRGDFAGLAQQLEKLCRETQDRAAQAELWLRLGRVRLAPLGNREGAQGCFIQAARVDPTRSDAVCLATEMLIDDGKAAEAAALWEQHLAALPATRRPGALRVQVIALYASQLNDPTSARRHILEALREDGAVAPLVLRHDPLFDDAEPEEQREFWERTLTALRDPAQQAERLSRLASLRGLEGGAPEEIARLLARALILAPEQAGVAEQLLAWSERSGSFGLAARALRQAADHASPSAAVALLRPLATLLEEKLAAPEQALAIWRRIDGAGPGDAQAHAAIERLLQRSGGSAEVLQNLEARIEAEGDAPRKLGLLQQLADKLSAQGDEPARALATYRRLLALDPHDRQSWEKLGQAARALSQWDVAAEALTQLSKLAATPEQSIAFSLSRLQLLAGAQQQPDAAVDQALALLAEHPGSRAVLAQLDGWAAQGIQPARIASALLPHQRAAGDHPRTLHSLQGLLAAATDPVARERLHLEIAAIHEQQLVDNRGALTALLDAARELPDSEAIARELARLSMDLVATAPVVQLWLELSLAAAGARADVLALRAARLAEAAGETDPAIQAYRAVLTRSPAHPEAVGALTAILRRQERWVECEQLLRTRLLSLQGAERVEPLLVLAEVLEKLLRHGDAAQVLEEALAAGADEETLLPRLAKALEGAQRHGELEQVLSRELKLAEARGDSAKVARLGLRRTRILEASLGDRDGAVQGYAEILATRPSDPEALASLENLLNDSELREKAARALIPAYEAVKEHRRLVQALEVLSDAAEAPADKVTALKRAAQVYANDLRQPELAFSKLCRALQLASGDAALRLAARRAAEEADCIGEFAEVVGECAELATGAAAIPLHRELAEVCERRLNDRARAAAAYARVLVIDPQNLDALRGLHRLHRATESFAELARTCRQLAEVVYDDAEKQSLLREAGALSEGVLKDPEGAAGAYRRLCELDAHDKDAAAALDRLYEKLQRPQDLAYALELRRTQEGPSPQGRELTFRLAELKRAQLGDLTSALLLFDQVLSADPSHVGTRGSLEAWVRGAGPDSSEALALLDPVLERVGDHARRIALREALLRGSPAEAKAKLHAEIRTIYLRDLAQPDMAFMSACRAFSEGIDRTGLLPELEKLARETNAFEELCEVYEDAIHGDEDEARVDTLWRRAASLRAQLSQPERAIELWKGLTEKKPGDREALDALTKLYEKSQSAQQLASLYRQKAQLAASPEERVGLLLQSAAARDQMADEQGAVETLREVLAIDGKNLSAWQQLDAIYPRLKKAREHADVLRALGELTEGAVRKGYLLRRASLLEKEAEAHEAVDAYAQVLHESPSEAQAVAGLERLFTDEPVRLEVSRLLEPVYRSTHDPRRLADVLEVRLDGSTDVERKALLAELAELRESLSQKPLAFALKLRAFRDEPGSASIREDLERLAADTSSFEELAGAYQDELERNAHPELAVVLWRSLAGLYADRLGALDQAAKALEEVAAREPQDLAVLESLARLYRKANALAELAVVYSRQVALEPAPRKKRDLLTELASLAEEKLSDPAAAIDAHRQLLQLEPTDANAMAALHRLLSGTERWDDLAAHMVLEVGLARAQGKAEEALSLQVRLGKLRQQRLADPRGAFELYRDVLTQKPGHAGAVSALEEMAKGEGPLRTEAALALEPIFSEGGDHQRLVQVLESRAAAAPPVERAILLRRVAEVYGGPLGSPEMAFMAATRALRGMPDDVAALAACQEYVDASGTHEELEALVSEVLPRATTDEGRIALYRGQAALCRGPLKDAHRAADAYLRILEIRPADTEALDQLSVLLRDQGEFETLLEIFRRKLSLAEGEDARAALLLRMAELQDEKMRDPGAAIATLHRLLQEVKPDDRTALARLDALCVRQERWVELADVLTRELSLAEVDKQTAQALQLKHRLAALREVKLQDRNGALALYKEILTQKPDHEDVVARLEQLLAREPSLDEAAAALEVSYRHAGNVAKLAQLLDQRASNAVDSFEKKRIYQEIATLRAERQNRPELAFMALCRAFREDPADEKLRRTLERMASAAESEEELVALYEEELPRVRDEQAAADIAYRAGFILDQKLTRPEEAQPLYEQAMALDPKVGVQGLPALDRAYRKSESWDQLAEVLRRAIDVLEEPREKSVQLLALGQLLEEKLGQPDRAAEVFEKILAIDPKSMPALRGLEKLYDAAQHWDRLYRVLEIQREVAPPAERERVLARMAEVSGHGLSNQSQSIQLYQQVLEKNPRSEPAFAALEGLYEEASSFTELSALLQKKLAFTVDPREIVRLNDKLGRVLFEHLDQTEPAVTAFKAVLDRDPRHRHALESLRAIFEKQGKTDDLVTMLRRLIPVQDDQAGVKRIRLRLAEVLAAANRKDEALDAARRVLDAEPHLEADLRRAEELFQKLGAYADQVKAMELRAAVSEQAGDTEAAVHTLFGVAETWTVQLKKREMALAAYDHILTLDPRNRLAFEQLRSLARELADWRRYATTSDRFLPSVTDPAEQLSLLKETAKLQIEKLGQKDLAFLTYCRAFKLSPTDAEVRTALGALAEENGSWEELAMVYEEAAESAPKGPVAELIYSGLAQIQDEHLDEPEAAEHSLRKVLEFDPANRTALDLLGQMHSRRGKDGDYVQSLEQKLEVSSSIEERKAVLREIARVHDERRKDPDGAIEALQRALNLEADRQTIDVLCVILRRERRFAELAQQLIRARDLAAHPAERAELQHQVAEVYERELTDDEAAIAGYRQALEFDPAHRDSISALEKLYTRLDRSAELLGVYNQQLEFVTDAKERVRILFKCASIWEDKYQNLANADSCLVAVLELDGRNTKAIKDLERLKRAQGRWDELVQVYDRHLSILSPQAVPDLVELLVAQGDVWYQKLSRVDRAAEIYNQALGMDPRSQAAMHALGVLYERSGNWPFALEMLGREAEVEKGPVAVELHQRMGKIHEDMLLDGASAKAAYQKAIDLDPSYLPALRQLKGIYQLERDEDGFLKVLIQEARATLDATEKTAAWVAVGEHYREKLEDRHQAAAYYEEALKVTPDSLAAARPLADIYVAHEDWERAEAMLDVVGVQLGKQLSGSDEAGKDLCRQLYRLGYVCEKLKKQKKALEAYRRAYELDATYLPALEGLGHLLVGSGEFEEANKVYQTILLQHGDDLTDLEVVEIRWQLGEIHLKTRQSDRAQNYFEKALEIDPAHEPSQRAMITLTEELGQYERALVFRRKLADVLEGDELFEMQSAMAKLSRDQLHDPFGAIDAFTAALKAKPDDLVTLDQLLALYRDTHQGQKAVDALSRILEQPTVQADASARKKGYFTLGEIYRDELKDDDKAVEAFNACLDVDPRFVNAFSAIEQLLAARKQWKKLEESYSAMIKRLPKTEDTHAARMALWRTLADLYLRVLKNPQAAMMAFEVVARSSPDDVATLEQYAALAAEQPEGQEKAIDAYRRALPLTATPGKAASALARLHAQRKEYDAAFVAAQVVVSVLGEGGPEEREIITKLTPFAKRREALPKDKVLTDRMWAEMLFHPKVRGPLGEILALLQTQAGPQYARRHGDLRLDPRKHRIDVATGEELAINTFRTVSHLLHLDGLEFYSPYLVARRTQMKGAGGELPPESDLFLDLMHLYPPAIRAGGALFKQSQQKELQFHLGKALTFARPEFALARLLPLERLEAVFQAAIKLMAPSFNVTANPTVVEQERRLLEKTLSEPAKQALAKLVRAYLKTQTLGDVRAFLEGAELTANRAGTLLAGSIEVAKNVIEKDPGTAVKLPPRSKIRDLMVFCLSPELMQLREALGINAVVFTGAQTQAR
jgi:tetratricopeptide (TPR) repeat protein